MADTTSQLQRYGKVRRKRGRVITVIIAALFLVAVVIGAVSYYGDHVGSFVVSVEKDSRVALSLSDTTGFENPRDMLLPKGVTDQTNTSFFTLPLNALNSGQGGEHSDLLYNEYFAYTFYLKNASKSGQLLNYNIKISLRTSTNNVDEAIRVMVVRDRDIDNKTGNRWIFAKADRDAATGELISEGGIHTTTTYDGYQSYQSTVFEGSTIGAIPIKAFPAGHVTTYTVVMWLEGEDPDCTDQIKGGAVMLDMEFAIADIPGG